MRKILLTIAALALMGGTAWAQGGTPKCYDAAGPANYPYQTCEAGVMLVTDNDNVTHDAAVGTDGPQLMGSARNAQEAAVANGDAARLVVNLYGELVLAAYSWTSDAIKTLEQDPISEHHGGATICDITDYAETASPHDEYWYIDMDGLRDLGLQLSLGCDNGTVTADVQCTLQDDGTAPAACDYDDVTMDAFGVAQLQSNCGGGAATADDIWIANIDTLGLCKYVRVHVEFATGNANDDGDATIFAKWLY